MTARNLQEEVKKKGLPWSAVKGFDTFTPIGYADQFGILLTCSHEAHA
jgi:acylpyruvate hydrolase